MTHEDRAREFLDRVGRELPTPAEEIELLAGLLAEVERGATEGREIMSVRPDGTRSACVIQVIETVALRGHGTPDDVVREVRQYWDFEGNLLAEKDPFPGAGEPKG